VTDLLACLDHLVQAGVTRAGAIAGHAASSGCLTLAAAANTRPELFAALVLEAPFVDWVAGAGGQTAAGAPLVGQHVLTAHEADEWGNPWQQDAAAQLIASMCPYTNLCPGARFPAVLVTAGLQDARVPHWMGLKFVAKLRSLQAGGAACAGAASADAPGSTARPALLQFSEEAGHFSMGVSGCSLEDVAVQQAFLLQHMPRTPVGCH
jgi:oligopeptidase B